MSSPSHYNTTVYSEVAAVSGKEFTISKNKCYGDVGYTSKTNAESKLSSCTKVSEFLLVVLVIASLLATVGAFIALGFETAQLKSNHQESQEALLRRIESAEDELLQLNTSFNVAFQQMNDLEISQLESNHAKSESNNEETQNVLVRRIEAQRMRFYSSTPHSM